MKKIIYFILLLVLLVFISAFLLFFTQPGNNILKPYIEKIVEDKIKMPFVLKEFNLRFGSVNIFAKIDSKIDARLNGDFELFSQKFDLKYMINAESLETSLVQINSNIDLNGTLIGSINDFDVALKGEALRSDITAFANIQRKIGIGALTLKANGINTAELLSLIGKPIYANGLIDVYADIKPVENDFLRGPFNVIIHEGKTNSELIKKDFNIELPKIVYSGIIKGNVIDGKLNLQSDILTNIGTLESTKGIFDLKTFDASSDYVLFIGDLSKLELITKTKLAGNIKLTGDVEYKNKILNLTSNSNFLDGKINAKLENKVVTFDAKDIQLQKLFDLLVTPRYSAGILNASLKLSDTDVFKSNGTINLEVLNATLEQSLIKKDFNITLPQSVGYSFLTKGELSKGEFIGSSSLKSSLVNLEAKPINVNLNTLSAKSNFDVNIPNLEKLETIINRKLIGSLNIKGDLSKTPFETLVNADTNIWNGYVALKLKDDVINADGADISISEMLKMLDYPQIFESDANFNANYDLKNKKGSIVADSKSGRLLRSQLTDILGALLKTDMTQEIFNDVYFKGDVLEDILSFDFGMQSEQSSLSANNAKFIFSTTQMNIPLDVNIHKRDFKAIVSGTTQSPKVKLDSSDYLKEKASKEVEKIIDKNVKEEHKDLLKGLLKKL